MMNLLRTILNLKWLMKAVHIGSSVIAVIDALVEANEACDSKPTKLYPIVIRRGGKKWTVQITVTCEEE